MTGAIQVASQAVLALLALLVAADYAVHRGARRRDTALMFASLAATVLVGWIVRALGPDFRALSVVTLLALVSHPFLMLRVVAHHRPVPRHALTAGALGMLAAWVAILLTGTSLAPGVLLPLVVYFVVCESYAGVVLVRGASEREGKTRRRMAFAAAGTALLALLILLAGVAVVAPAVAPILPPLSLFITAMTALAYYLGFAPPDWVPEWWRRLRLSGQVGTLVGLATLLTAVGTAAAVTWQLRSSWTADLEASHQTLARLSAQAVAQHLTAARRSVDQAAVETARRLGNQRGPWDWSQAQEIVADLPRQTPNLASAFVLDEAGVVRATTSTDRNGIGRSFADRDYFQGAMRTGAAYVASPFLGSQTGRPTIVLATPITAPDGVRRGVIAVSFDLDRLAEALEPPGAPGGTRVVVAAADGSIAIHPDASRLLRPAAEESPSVALALAGHAGAEVQPETSTDPERLVAYAPVPEFGWAALVSTPTQQAFAPIAGSILRSWPIAAALVLLFASTSVAIARRLLRPVRQLSAAADRFTEGHLDERAPLAGAEDLHLLASRFNALAAAVQEQTLGLRQQFREAEGRASSLRFLLDLAESVASETDPRAVAEEIVDRMGDIVPAGVRCICSPVPDGGLEILAAAGGDSSTYRGHRLEPGAGVSGRAFRTGQVERSDDVSTDPDYVSIFPGMRSVLAVPIRRGEQVLGVLALGSARLQAFDDGDLAIAQVVASHAALAFARAELVDQLRQQNDALAAASRHKSEFLANMSHELRTPLNAINGFSQLLMLASDGEYDESTRRAYLATINESGSHLLQLINDILDISKVEAGKMELRPSTIDVGAVIKRVLATVEPLAARKKILLSAQVDGIGDLYADEGRFKQVLYNLLSNAIKFTPENGAVAVVGLRLEEGIRLTVADTGIGIAPEHHERIFEEFHQVDGGADRRYEGTGLGLALTRRLVELHGGTISVESAPGQGSQFHVWFPARAPAHGEEPRPQPGALPSLAGPAAGPLVLVVENDPRSARLIAVYLARGGYRVEVATNGVEALTRARQLRPVAITLDIQLPEADGWEVLRALKLDLATADIPVVVVSVIDDEHVGYALGAVDYLVKPIDGAVLLERIRRHTAPRPPKGRTRVLVVDDDPAAIELLAGMLQPAGFEVLRADGGAAGIAIALEQLPDIVMLDLMMPDVTGFEVATALKAEPTTRNIPILIVTAKDLTRTDKEELQGQVEAILSKGSLAREELLGWLEEVIKGKAATPVLDAAGAAR